MKKLLIFAAIGYVFFASCKEDEETSPVLTATDLLTQSSWKYKSFNNDLKACDADDLITYSTDGHFTADLGSDHCVNTEPDSLSGTWFFDNEETRIIQSYLISGNELRDTLDIITLDDELFEYVDENNNNVVLEH